MTYNSNHNLINWEDISLDDNSLEFIYNYLLEKETPMSPYDLAKAVISEKIRLKKKAVIKQENAKGKVYRPKDKYNIGDEIIFPLLKDLKGKIIEIRAGNNPDISKFNVATLVMEDGSTKQFSSDLSSHKLNDFDYSGINTSLEMDPVAIYNTYGKKIALEIQNLLSRNEGLVSIANYWFPQALLTEINPGYLNLAEAVLEMEEGRPFLTKDILEMIEYPMDSNDKLTEFSFNYALHADERFDEVGPTGIVLWTLKLLEPEDVRKKPLTLRYFEIESPRSRIQSYSFEQMRIHDELDVSIQPILDENLESFDICINYPHWKAGTLPLIGKIHSIFPTALETDKVVFKFIDTKSNQSFPGWVVIPEKYVYGLKTWYRENNVIPGSIFRISKGENLDDVAISLIPPRASKDWIRTALFDPKGKLYFETRHQSISTEFDERMCVYIQNSPQLDIVWEQNNRAGINFKRLIENIFKDLSRSNPQGIVHFQEIYAGVNMMHRCPPGPLLDILLTDNQFVPLDDLYFKLNTKEVSEEVYP